MVRRITLLGMAIAVLAIYPARAGDAVEPASVAMSNIRGEAVQALSSEVYYRDSTLLFTNCVAYSDTSGVVTQGLSEVTITLTIGNAVSSTDYSGTAYGAVTNTWWASTTVPTNITGTINVQLKLVDENTNSYIYPWKTLSHRAAL